MSEHKLSEDKTFAVEYLKDKLRLIVLNKGTEMACRMVSPSALKKFLEESSGTIFKGRLQLHKFGREMMVTVSGIRIGSMPVTDLVKAIDQETR